MSVQDVESMVRVCEKYGFLFPRFGLAVDVDEATELAKEIGFPVVLKVSSPDIIHKAEVGGVELNLRSEDEIENAFMRINESVRIHSPQAHIDGILVEEMCTTGQEFIIGLLRDAQFGPCIMFGLGGTFVEILDEVSFRALPINEAAAKRMIYDVRGKEIIQGYRGVPGASEELLTRLIMQAAQMGEDLTPNLGSVDFNPIRVWKEHHRVLDVKFLLTSAEEPTIEPIPNVRHLKRFFKARSVALVGASETPGKIGAAALDTLANHEYRGKVYPINPRRKVLMGLATYPSVSALPDEVDLGVIAVGLRHVPELLNELDAKNIKNVVIISGGGKELGDEGRELEARIARLAKQKSIRIVGPNCIGVFDGETRLDTFFHLHDRLVRPPDGPIAVLTQSGTVGAILLEWAANLGVSKFVSYGNRVDVDESDLMAFLAEDPDTRVILCYIEGVAEGRKLFEAARDTASKKPVVIFKAGRSEPGARASMSHTGFFGGTHKVFEGVMKQAGVITVDSIEELFAAAKALVMQPKANGRQVAMIGNGAGPIVQAIDLLESYGLEMACLEEKTVHRLNQVYPPFYIIKNPIDVTGSGTSDDYKLGIETLLQDTNVDIIMPWFVFQGTPLQKDIIDTIVDLASLRAKPILCGAMGGPYTDKMSAAIEAGGAPVFKSVRDWVSAAMSLAPQEVLWG